MDHDDFWKGIGFAIIVAIVLFVNYGFTAICVKDSIKDSCDSFGKVYLLNGWYECRLEGPKPK